MGHCPTEPLRPQFYRRLRLRFFGAKVTSDAGLLAYRELDDALDSTRTAAGQLQDVPVHGSKVTSVQSGTPPDRWPRASSPCRMAVRGGRGRTGGRTASRLAVEISALIST